MNTSEMYSFISRQSAACIAMTDREGTPTIMPLPGPPYRDGNALCFIVRNSDPKVEMLRRNPIASICFQSHQTPYYSVMLDGRARINRDADVLGRAWMGSIAQQFYNGYMNDQDFTVLRFIWHTASFRTARTSGPVL